ncbi:hypothetical protein RB2654_15470 [Rhodobacterales bacterium HTCC2654]|nr:hypothetical protein RB2654_15470 [Rhodobacterales bacterium HTCC2654] [Maritimibacter alkaliphilus HTCC2654]
MARSTPISFRVCFRDFAAGLRPRRP